MKTPYFCRLSIIVFCLSLAVPTLNLRTGEHSGLALAASAPKAKAAAPKATAAESQEVLTKKLHEFGVRIAEQYNKHVKGSKAKKDITKNANGGYTAVYHEIDTESITCSYTDSSNPKGPVKYIGMLKYSEVKYVCTAPSRAEAEKGPFTPQRSTTTELVKYVNGKWSY